MSLSDGNFLLEIQSLVRFAIEFHNIQDYINKSPRDYESKNLKIDYSKALL